MLAIEWQIAKDYDFRRLVFSRQLESADAVRVPVGVLEPNRIYWVRMRYLDRNGLPSEWSPRRRIVIDIDPNDQDNNGIDDRYQVAPGMDTDGNGVPDDQEGMCNLADAVAGNVIGFRPSSGRIRCLTSIEPSSIRIATAASNAGFSHGMFSFGVENLPVSRDNPAEITLEIYFPEPLPAGTRWEKYDEVTGERRPFAGRVEIDGRRVILHLVDGSADDADGLVNGKIVDPSGPVLPTGGSTGGTPAATASGGGGGSVIWTLLLMLPGLYRRQL